MPIYEYQCKDCRKVTEILQKINSEPLKKCMECSGELEKLISVSSFQFKGNGWYDTDYKNRQEKKERQDDKPVSVSEDLKKEKKKESTNKSSDKRKSENVA